MRTASPRCWRAPAPTSSPSRSAATSEVVRALGERLSMEVLVGETSDGTDLNLAILTRLPVHRWTNHRHPNVMLRGHLECELDTGTTALPRVRVHCLHLAARFGERANGEVRRIGEIQSVLHDIGAARRCPTSSPATSTRSHPGTPSPRAPSSPGWRSCGAPGWWCAGSTGCSARWSAAPSPRRRSPGGTRRWGSPPSSTSVCPSSPGSSPPSPRCSPGSPTPTGSSTATSSAGRWSTSSRPGTSTATASSSPTTRATPAPPGCRRRGSTTRFADPQLAPRLLSCEVIGAGANPDPDVATASDHLPLRTDLRLD